MMTQVGISPDGQFYLHAGAGHAVPRPYCYRWLLPSLFSDRLASWVNASRVSVVGCPLALAWLLAPLGPLEAAFGVALWCGLAGVTTLPMRLPVLVDAPAMLAALLAAGCVVHGHPWSAAACALVAGATRETAPIFAALWCWSPLPLVGLLAAGWWRRALPPDGGPLWLTHPVRAALAVRTRFGSWPAMLARLMLPWGAVLPLAASRPSLALGACFAVAYAQLFVAQDCVRLYQWAAPAAISAAVVADLPAWSWAPILAIHLLNPWRGEGL